ncbi:MAG: ABC transporter permease subunit [Desulfobacula sp.]|jgi:ABC-type transport system involved in multi-copper enzyme maturation permease subunit|uniref:ABC transporter permease n=1 Tax=Desulfobacula sp. TaxID=2593537 RepID=UPI001D1E0AC7|nr:ABC transporter permease subunit [Desulfobacula sp.]MBT3486898.1 ABC transporter permease subunit [Desulfobacula sp.]MBT3805626.1 ABC transporter permease subunit [Desulfobacula sp.]MBT4026498.1 ABC transporter permease subunit [Desulfobacula sp.]MBT4199611.1 ABC transporter permease subunit [Desulfobacula sp.]
MMTRKLFALTILTFKEGVRDRALFGIGLFSLLLMAGSIVVVSMFMRELHKVTVDINLSAITFAGLLLSFFVSINLMSKDIDRYTIYSVLSKPFSRSQYIWGKYLGIMLLIVTAMGILTFCSSLAIWFTKSQYSLYFQGFSWMEFYKAVYAELLMFFLLNALIVFFSTITTSSFITLLFSISTYIAGQTIEEVVLFLKTKHAAEIFMSEGINTIIGIVQYILPNLSVFDLKLQSAHAITISWDYLAAVTGYSIVYSIVLLIMASLIFNKRELR